MQGIYLSAIVTLCVAIVYWLDAPNEIASTLWRLVSGRVQRVELRKPLGCNVCMTFWLTLIVLLILTPRVCWLAFVWAWVAKYLYYVIEVLDKVIMRVLMFIESKL